MPYNFASEKGLFVLSEVLQYYLVLGTIINQPISKHYVTEKLQKSKLI